MYFIAINETKHKLFLLLQFEKITPAHDIYAFHPVDPKVIFDISKRNKKQTKLYCDLGLLKQHLRKNNKELFDKIFKKS